MIRRLLLALSLAAATLVVTPRLQAQNQKPASEETETRNEPDFKWHLLNTAIFFGLAGFAIAKLSPSFFNARTADIQRAIQEATGLKLQADFRSSEIDRKMATLPEAVAKMRAESQAAMAREHERRQAETAESIARIQKSLAGELENVRSEATRQIRSRAMRVAFRLAQQRLRDRARMQGNAESIADFTQLVERGRS